MLESVRSLIWVLFSVMVSTMMAAGGIEVHGHRGARAILPENSLPAFEYAIEQGVDVLELDVSVTSDDVLVVSHDPVLSKTLCKGTGTRVIREMTLDQLRQWDCGEVRNPEFPEQTAIPGTKVPTLDEVFNLATRSSFHFNVETKIFRQKPKLAPPPDEFARLLWEAIRRHGLESRMIVQSFDYRTLHAMRRLAPEIRRSALFYGPVSNLVKEGKKAEADTVSPHYRLVTAKKVAAAHAAGFRVIPWTANTPKVWRQLVEAGVDGIITDDPAALQAWLRQREAAEK